MKRLQLSVQKRDVLGKKVKKLRKDGILPANIYGKDIQSLSVQVPLKDFEAVYKETGETGLVDLQIDGATRPVLIHNAQLNHRTHQVLHADFFQVNLKEKVKTMVPVVVTGEPKAVSEKLGILLQQISEVEVEALPADLPENIEVAVENLAAVGDQITVDDLKAPTGVEVLTDPNQVVVKIDELVSKEAQEQAATEAAAAEAAKAESDSAKVASEATKAEEGAQAGEPASEGETPLRASSAETAAKAKQGSEKQTSPTAGEKTEESPEKS